MHTPGPWVSNNDGPDSYTITANVGRAGGNWKLIAELCQTDMASAQCTSEEIEANARLIAAAPDLLEACKAAIGFCVNARQTWTDWAEHPDIGLLFAKMRTVVDKAEGTK